MSEKSSTPWHLWIVGLLWLVWSAGGAYDYIMTQMRNASYMSHFTPEQRDYFYGFPVWLVAAWALGVWGGVLGSLLLLLRSRWAVFVYALSLVATLAATIYNFVLADILMSQIAGPFALAFTAVIIIAAALVLFYARWLSASGILR